MNFLHERRIVTAEMPGAADAQAGAPQPQEHQRIGSGRAEHIEHDGAGDGSLLPFSLQFRMCS
jgi:hypothetical protein